MSDDDLAAQDAERAEHARERHYWDALTEDEPSEPISPEFRQRLIAAVERPLRVRRAILLLAAHASGHVGSRERGCGTCHAGWPCADVRRAAAPAIEAFADCDDPHAVPADQPCRCEQDGTPCKAHGRVGEVCGVAGSGFPVPADQPATCEHGQAAAHVYGNRQRACLGPTTDERPGE